LLYKTFEIFVTLDFLSCIEIDYAVQSNGCISA